MPFELFIARRYLFPKEGSFFLSLLRGISLSGMSLSVFALIFVLAVMEGFERDFQRRIIRFKAPLTVRGQVGEGEALLETVRKIQAADPRIRSVVPVVEGEALVEIGDGGAAGLHLRGVWGNADLDRLGEVDHEGSLGEREILIGSELANTIGADLLPSDEVRLVFPFGEVAPTGDLLPVVRTFRLAGTFRTGFYEYDSKFVISSYEEISALLGEYGRPGLEVWIDRFRDAEEVKLQIQKAIPPLDVSTWQGENPKLFHALKLERIGMLLLLVVLMAIAACTIFGLISLTVMERRAEVALLRSLGLSAPQGRNIFLWTAIGIGFLGSLLGGILGLSAVFLLLRYPFRLPSSYYVEYLPIHFNGLNILGVLVLAPLIALLAALYPARQSVVRPAAELLRYE